MIEAQDLKKVFGHVRAVDGVTFRIEQGEVVGLLGPNGAGKSTTMKVLTCYIPPTEGTASVGGHDCINEPMAVRRQIGYLPENTPLYEDMTVREYLRFAWSVRGMRSGFRERLRIVVDACGLHPVVPRPIGQLSKGFRQRVGIAQAMLHDPPVMILDEPTSGLDPGQILEIRELIRSLAEKKTIILSTHILQEVTAVCSRILIISNGRLVSQGTPDEVQQMASGGHSVRAVFKDGISGGSKALSAIPGVTAVTADKPEAGAVAYRLVLESGMDVRADIFDLAVKNNWTLLELTPSSGTLEEAFIELTRENPVETSA